MANCARSGCATWSASAKCMPGWKSPSMPLKSGAKRWAIFCSTGRPGLGKTTFATCIPRDLGVSFQIASGAALAAPKDLIPYLTNAEERSVLFIDEIHRLPKPVEEFLYPAMEDFRIDILLGEGVNARTINMPLRPFTLIGATTRAGMISAPLRDRFHLREHLDFYSVAELAEIVRRSAAKLQVPIDAASAEEIAGRSRGTPRLANNRLRWVRDYVTSKADGRINLELTRAALAMQGIDVLGLDGAGSQISGNDRPRVSRRPGRRRSGRPYAEHCDRHAVRRSRAVSAPIRTGDPHAARPESHSWRLSAPRPGRSRRSRGRRTAAAIVQRYVADFLRVGRRESAQMSRRTCVSDAASRVDRAVSQAGAANA